MGKLSKYTGIDLYEKYILPTNPSSKNPLWKQIMGPLKSDYSVNNKTDSLKNRLFGAYLLGGAHFLLAIFVTLSGKDLISASFIIKQLLINIYPILVQLKIRNRIIRVLQNREKKEKTKEEEMETTIESDIEQLKEIISVGNMGIKDYSAIN